MILCRKRLPRRHKCGEQLLTRPETALLPALCQRRNDVPVKQVGFDQHGIERHRLRSSNLANHGAAGINRTNRTPPELVANLTPASAPRSLERHSLILPLVLSAPAETSGRRG